MLSPGVRRLPAVEPAPICVLLLPAPLESFILREQAEDLLRADGVIAADPPRMPYGAFARMPPWLEAAAGKAANLAAAALLVGVWFGLRCARARDGDGGQIAIRLQPGEQVLFPRRALQLPNAEPHHDRDRQRDDERRQ